MENKFLVRNLKISFRLLVILMMGLSISLATSCKKDDDDDDDDDNKKTENPIPSDSEAGVPPTIDNNTLEQSIPNPSFSTHPSDASRIVMQMTGVKDPVTDQYIAMAGTGDPNQTCWVQVDGTNKGILVTKGSAREKALLADIVFTVDNSGSMDAEADSIALQITQWVNYLQSQGLDLQVGVVGYDSYVTGALNLTGSTQLYSYLNNRTYYGEPIYGTMRTMGFFGSDSAYLANNAAPFGYAWGENGVLAVKFANQYFNWRAGANRIYVNFTDEPNQPGGEENAQWSVIDMETNWHPTQGTIHTVFSEDTTYYSGYWSDYYDEKPWRLSEITGGTYIFVLPDASDLNLNQLPVTGALAETFTIEYMNNEGAGPHTVKIIIENTNGNDGARTYEEIFY